MESYQQLYNKVSLLRLSLPFAGLVKGKLIIENVSRFHITKKSTSPLILLQKQHV